MDNGSSVSSAGAMDAVTRPTPTQDIRVQPLDSAPQPLQQSQRTAYQHQDSELSPVAPITPLISPPITSPVTPEPEAFASNNDSEDSVAVVKVMNVRGLEYLMMSIALWFGAAGLIWGILSIVNGGASFSVLAMPASLALVGVPIFALLFLRLKKAELKDPSLRLSTSKRRSSHITQVLAFLVCLFNLITFVYIVFSNIGGESSISIGKAVANLFIVLAVAGGILAYYWFNEHHIQKGA